MDELFDVLEDGPAKTSAGKVPNKPKKSKKRQANGDLKPTEASSGQDTGAVIIDVTSTSESNGAAAQRPEVKRQKLEEPDAIVTDSFEQEQIKEVVASAGLQPQTEGETGSINLSYQVRHQVALPPDYENYVPLAQHVPPEQPAKEYQFELDSFQKAAVASIERNESVLVSAHTSAGKTVVAEYAIAQSLKSNARVIYTSPIKALSNQKYREFYNEFRDVGLMTGDVTLNPSASCLVMTTEILRSMLYKGSEVMREVAWVVFDEVHYLRDKERGVVWEETMILLPDRVRYVFLSATIPNAMQFAEWIAKIHNQPCHVVYTDYRPTPLQHYMYPAGAEGIHLVVDEKGRFREPTFQTVMSMVASAQGYDPADVNARGKKKGGRYQMQKGRKPQGSSDIYKIVRMLMFKNFNPVIVFSFAKRECEDYALQMANLVFNDDDEQATVEKVFGNAMDRLTAEDRQLPQIEHILPLLKKGIAVHHSGLLPILKETIEILFQEQLVKVLFATETFSIGLNMPAKTVVFTSVRKFDGKNQRWITPSEFIQMSGRAGRRGIDERGIVIMMIDERMEPSTAKDIVRGEQDRMNSAFHLGYNMVLNLLRVEGISPEYMLERSFFQFQNTASVSHLEKQLGLLENERENIQIQDEATIRDYYELRQQLDIYSKDMRDVITLPQYCLQYMQSGRLVRIKYKDFDFGWGAVVNFTERKPGRNQQAELKPQESYIVDVLLTVAQDGVRAKDPIDASRPSDLPIGVRPPPPGERGRIEVVPVLLSCVESISHIRIFLPNQLTDADQRSLVRKSIDEVKKRFPDGIAVLDPIDNMGIHDDGFKKLVRKIEVLESRLLSNPLHNSPRLPDLYKQYEYKVALGGKIKQVKKDIAAALSIIQLDELKCRKRVLRRLGFINESDVVQLKARVACEISTGDELVLAELLFNRFFNEMSPQECAAVLSCFIFEEKSKDPPRLSEQLGRAFREIQAQARTVIRVSQECKLDLDEKLYLGKFKSEIMEVVYTWTNGASFAQICKMTDVYEGSLIRLFRRLEELVRQMALAAKVMGSDELAEKFERALKLLVRDVIACQSLYLDT